MGNQYDGSVRLDTAIDTAGLKRALALLQETVDAFVSKTTQTFKSTDKTIEDATEASHKLNASFHYDTAGIEQLTQRQATLQQSIENGRVALSSFADEEKKLDALYQQGAIDKGEFDKLRAKVVSTERAIADQEDQLLETTKAIAGYGGQSEKSSEAVRDLGKNSGAASAKVEGVGESGKKASSGISEMNVAMGNLISNGIERVISALGEAINKFLEFGEKAVKTRTLLDETVVSYGEAKDKMLEIASETGKGASDVADGMYQALSAGVETKDLFSFMETASKTAVAGFTDVNTAVDVLTSTMNAFGIEGEKSLEVSDKLLLAQEKGKLTVGDLGSGFGDLAALASSANISLDETLSALAALTAGGVKPSTAMASLRQAISGIIKPTSEASQLAQDLNIQFNAQALSAKGLARVLDEVKRKTGGNIEKMATLFGSVEALSSVLALTGEGGALFTQTLDEMGNAAGKTGATFNMITSDPAVRLQVAMNKLATQATEVGEAFSPLIDIVSTLFGALASIDPKILSTVAILAMMIPVFISITKLIKSVSGLFGMEFSPAAMRTTAIIVGVVIALMALAAAIVVILGKKEDFTDMMSSVGSSTSSLQNNISAAQNSYNRAYATGTASAARGVALVGERGPELVEFKGGERIYSATQTLAARAVAGSVPAAYTTLQNIYVTIDAKNVREFNDVVRIAQNARQSRRMGYVKG